MIKKQKHDLAYSRLSWIFFKVGCLAFGGWSTTSLLLENELTKKHKYMSTSDIHGPVTYAQVIPGGTQTAIVSGVGYRIDGTTGSVLATFFYLLPSVIMITTFSLVYFHYLRNTQLTSHLNILRAALGGIILANAYKIGKQHATLSSLWLFIIVAFLVKLLLGINSVIIILAYAAAGLAISLTGKKKLHNDR